jgi:hypothetical protein
MEDASGNGVNVSYGRSTGLALGLTDDLGHTLELCSNSACRDGLARELYESAESAGRTQGPPETSLGAGAPSLQGIGVGVTSNVAGVARGMTIVGAAGI